MQIVIKLSEKDYKSLNRYINFNLECEDGRILSAVKQGVVLPENHGRLGDLDKIKKEMQNYHDDCAKTSEYTRLGFETAIAVVEDAQTIIEADKE